LRPRSGLSLTIVSRNACAALTEIKTAHTHCPE